MGRVEYRKDEKGRNTWVGGGGRVCVCVENSRPTLHLCKVETCIKSHFVVGPSEGLQDLTDWTQPSLVVETA